MVSRRLDLSQSKNSLRMDNIQNVFYIAIEKILSLQIMIKKIMTGICKKICKFLFSSLRTYIGKAVTNYNITRVLRGYDCSRGHTIYYPILISEEEIYCSSK